MVDAALLSFNFTLGLFAFFSPCGFPMLPAYIAYYLPGKTEGPQPPWRAALRGLSGGLLAALGAFSVLLLIGALAVAIGAPFKQRVAILELVGGVIVIAMGTAMILGRGFSLKMGFRPSQARGALSIVGFGALYAATASACVAPALIGVLFPAFAAESFWVGLVQVGAYAMGMAILLVVASIVIAMSQDKLVRAMRKVVPHVEKVMGTLLIAAGVYLIWFWAAVEYGIPAPPSMPLPALP